MIQDDEKMKLHAQKCKVCKKTYAVSTIKRCINICYSCYLSKLKKDVKNDKK